MAPATALRACGPSPAQGPGHTGEPTLSRDRPSCTFLLGVRPPQLLQGPRPASAPLALTTLRHHTAHSSLPGATPQTLGRPAVPTPDSPHTLCPQQVPWPKQSRSPLPCNTHSRPGLCNLYKVRPGPPRSPGSVPGAQPPGSVCEPPQSKRGRFRPGGAGMGTQQGRRRRRAPSNLSGAQGPAGTRRGCQASVVNNPGQVRAQDQ